MTKKEKTTQENKQKELNIYQKLAEVHKEIPYLQKDGKGYNYKYVSDVAILAIVRPKMQELGLLLEMDSLKPTCLGVKEKITLANGAQTKTQVQTFEMGFRFTWINIDNPEERIEKIVYLLSDSGDVKATGALYTYAMRYFLLKYFNIPTAEEDVDYYEHKTNTISKEQLMELIRVMDEIERVAPSAKDYLTKEICGFEKVSDLSQVKQGRFEKVLAMVNEKIENNIKPSIQGRDPSV